MLLLTPDKLAELEADLLALAQLKHVGRAEEAWLSRLDNLLPPQSISTLQWTKDNRVHKSPDGIPVKTNLNLTPYANGILETADLAGVRVIGVEGNARSTKTVIGEDIVLKRWAHGPFGDLLWYMQSEGDIEDYMEERGLWMLENHEQVWAKVDNGYKRNARDRKRIGANMARWLPATKQTTRGKGAPLIVADEIDGYPKLIMKAILTLIMNRQREFGAGALAYICSHPDAGPKDGIARIVREGMRHLWWWTCFHCGGPSSPSPYAATQMKWNIPTLWPQLRSAEMTDVLDYGKANVRLVCPHCQALIDNEERKRMSIETGAWVQPGQIMVAPKKVDGERLIREVMGFCIHSHMAPFIQLHEAADEWLRAMNHYELHQDEEPLRQVMVKTMGEVMENPNADQRLDDWTVIRTRMKSGDVYAKKTVPAGVHFLVAFVDIQKRGFEVRVIGYNAFTRETWLIDAYLVGQHMTGDRKMEPVRPFSLLGDWFVLEDAVLNQTYPLAENSEYHLPIAKMGIDTGGGFGKVDNERATTTNNARMWASTILHRRNNPIADWKIALLKGSNQKKGEIYGKPRQVLTDDRGRPLDGGVWERTPIVYEIKKMIRRRQHVQTPGPGFMYAPYDLEDQYFRELASESFVADEWIRNGANETWDAYVGSEVLRESLFPEDATRIWEPPHLRPIWARPFRPGQDPEMDTQARRRVNPYARMVRINNGDRGDGDLDGSQ